MSDSNKIELAVEEYVNHKHVFQRFLNAVVDSFKLEPSLNDYSKPVLHSIKYRLKDEAHLRGKLARKSDQMNPVTAENLFERITDLAGVRVLHLYQDQLPVIHSFITGMASRGDWVLNEDPVAYSWDPESQRFFESLNIEVKLKESFYTSIHYVVRPGNDDRIKCEIQVRTLFEEIWGEIDHTVNYPHPSSSRSTKEQLRVLSKLVSTGSRLADSIFRLDDGERSSNDKGCVK